MAVGIAIFETDVLALDPAELPHAFPERLVPRFGRDAGERRQEADQHGRWLLPPRRMVRGGHGSAGTQYQLTPANRGHQAVQPPSATSDDPVNRAAAGEARNTTAFATSSTVPARPRGMRSGILFLVSGSSKNGLVSGVITKVGAIETTRPPFGASSTAIALVSPSIACLVIT